MQLIMAKTANPVNKLFEKNIDKAVKTASKQIGAKSSKSEKGNSKSKLDAPNLAQNHCLVTWPESQETAQGFELRRKLWRCRWSVCVHACLLITCMILLL